MPNELNKKIQTLTKLVEKSADKRLLWEEMQIISKKAFELQDQIMAELDQIEALETDLVKVQSAFSARESIWDLISQITDREQALRERTHHKETPAEKAKRHHEVMAEARAEAHHCCCGHHHEEGCCQAKAKKTTGSCHSKKTCRGKTCRKKSI